MRKASNAKWTSRMIMVVFQMAFGALICWSFSLFYMPDKCLACRYSDGSDILVEEPLYSLIIEFVDSRL